MPLIIDNNFKSTVRKSFDQLFFHPKHQARSKSDTYFIDNEFLMRPHITANELDYLARGYSQVLLAGRVFRRDQIDKTHFPMFHQLEGVVTRPGHLWGSDGVKNCYFDLKSILEKLAVYLFGKDIQFRWVETHFPYTYPSLELEVYFRGAWLEILGCGILHDKITTQHSKTDSLGWAFGIGLERLLMILNEIEDIRTIWIDTPQFLEQFDYYKLDTKFKANLMSESITRDVSFWISDRFEQNAFLDFLREAFGDEIEDVKLIDQYVSQHNGHESRCYRLFYRGINAVLSENEVNGIHDIICQKIGPRFGVVIR